MAFREYLTGIIYLVLLIWGPIDHDIEYGIVIRICYLIIIPFLFWLIIRWIWNYFDLNRNVDIILNKILSVLIAFTLVVFAVLETFSNYHIENTQVIQTRFVKEDVGDFIKLPGTDWGNVLFLILGSAFFIWLAFSKNVSKSQEIK